MKLTDAERQTLAEIGMKLGKQALEEVATLVKPDTILAWHRKLAAQKFDGSDQRKSLGRLRVDKEFEDLVVQMAKANRSWGYDRIAGALAHLGYDISDQTVGNILKQEENTSLTPVSGFDPGFRFPIRASCIARPNDSSGDHFLRYWRINKASGSGC